MASATGVFSFKENLYKPAKIHWKKETKWFIIYFGLLYRSEVDEEVSCEIIRYDKRTV